MANWNDTIFQCNNPEVIKAFKLACENDGKRHRYVEMQGDNARVNVSTAWDTAHDTAQAVSKQFPNDVITCCYSFEADRFSEIKTVECRNGEARLIDITPGYCIGAIPLDNENDRNAIVTKAVSFCRKLDRAEKNTTGTLFLNWFKDEVIYKFEHDGTDGKKYRIEATKKLEQIEFKVFEGLIKYDWQEIRFSHDDDPF